MNKTVAKPTARQLQWQDMELGVIIHWCMEIYNPGFEGYKTSAVRTELAPERIRPKNLDVDSWLRAAFRLGAKYAVLVVNHCTGFSLWPTKENDYSVASLEWKNGKGDIIADFITACGKYGIRPALYYSTGCNGYYNIDDSVRQDYFSQKYRDYVAAVERQLTEIWSGYGDLFEIWFDGGVIPKEMGGPDVETLLRKYQPEAITFQGPRGYENNIRWIGNEDGHAPENCFCAVDNGIDEADPKGCVDGRYYCPAEADFPNRTHEAFGGGWGWREGEEHTVIPPEELFGCYLNTVGRNTNMLLGMGISTDGDFRDEEQFAALGAMIRKEFSDEIPAAVEKDGETYIVRPQTEKKIKYVVIRENLENGQHICGFELTADGRLLLEQKSIGHKRIVRLNAAVNEIKLKVTASFGEYEIRDIRIYA